MALVSGFRSLNWRSLWLPVLLVLVVAGALITVVVLSQQLGGSDAPAEAPPFVPPAAPAVIAQDVKQRDGDTLQLIRQRGQSNVEQNFNVPAGMPLERLQPAVAADIVPGDHVTVIGVPNEYNTFAVRFIVAIPDPVTGPQGFAQSPAGFLGHEASRDPNDRPQLSSVVERVDGLDIYLRGPDGPIKVRVEPEARFFRLEAVDVDAIIDGDRVAGEFDGTVRALLIMPGGGS